MAKLRMAHASTHGARKPPGPIAESDSHCISHETPKVLDCNPKYLFLLTVQPTLYSMMGVQPQK